MAAGPGRPGTGGEAGPAFGGESLAVLACLALGLGGCLALALATAEPGAKALVLSAWVALVFGAAVVVRRPAKAAPGEHARGEAVPLAVVRDLVTWHDRDGDVVRASAAAAEICGASARDLRGGGFIGRVEAADRPAILKALSEAARGTSPGPVEFRLRPDPARPEALPASLELEAHRLPEPDGAGAVVVAFTRDTSARRRHERELEQARREAVRANDLKGRFLATVSHELRTPLNAIIGFSELLAAEHPFVVTEERRREYAGIIGGSGRHLLELVNTLLDMSKIETGNFPFDPEPFSFADLARSACDLIQIKADQAGVRLERRIADDIPEITADRRACRQILLNILSNAVKFTPAGGQVTITVAARGAALELSIADTGIGIPEADGPRLGDPFFQSGQLHRRNHEGTGLGLSVVRGLVGLHGGRLAVESDVGLGTTVSVTLPLAGPSDPKAGKPAAIAFSPRLAPRPQEGVAA